MLGRVRSPGRQTDRDRREFRLHNSQNWTIAGSRHAPELPGTADIIHERAVIATTEIGAGLRAVRLTPGVGGCRALKAAVAILRRSLAVPFASDSFRNEWRIPPRRLEGDHLQISPKEDDPSSVVSMSTPMTAVRWRRLSSTEFPSDGIERGSFTPGSTCDAKNASPKISHRLVGNERHPVPDDPLLVGD